MLPQEIFLILLLLSAHLIGLSPSKNNQKIRLTLLLICITLTAYHFIFDFFRWQMLPIYAYIYIYTLFLFTKACISIQVYTASIKTISIHSIAILGLTCIPLSVPILTIPKPTGVYTVGTEVIHLIDKNREEIFQINKHLKHDRSLVIQVWYPATSKTNTQNKWHPHANILARAISKQLHAPSFFFNHLKHSTTNSYISAPIHKDKTPFPIIFISHSWSGFKNAYTALSEELASHGYIVISVEHPYASIISCINSKVCTHLNNNTFPIKSKTAKLVTNQWSDDLSFILKYFRAHPQDKHKWLTSHMDFKKVAGIGHSTGGTAILRFCQKETSCKAGIGLDVWFWPITEKSNPYRYITKPMLFLFGAQKIAFSAWEPNQNYYFFTQDLFPYLPDHIQTFSIKGASHFDFADSTLFSPIASFLGMKGNISGKRMTTLVRQECLDFLNQQFKPNTITTKQKTNNEITSLKNHKSIT